MIFQQFNLFDSMTVAQNIAYPLKMAGASAKEIGARVEEMLALVGLTEKRDAYPGELSGGQKAKVLLLKMSMSGANVLILDEPTAALDPVTENEIYTKFHEIIGKKTALFISHRLSACRFAGEILVFEKGDIVQRGSHDSLCAQEGLYRRMWEAQAKYYADGQKA